MTTSPDSNRVTRKIHFLTKEIQIPDDVSDATVSEIQKILNDLGTPLLKFGQQLTACAGSEVNQNKSESNSQFGKCLNISNQFEVNNSDVVLIFFRRIYVI